MPRPVVVVLALIALALVGTAAFPWTLSGGSLSASIADYLHSQYGVNLRVKGRSTIAFLPMPRVKFEDVELAAPMSGLRSEGGTLRAELRLFPLMFGRIEVSEAALSDARITASLDQIRSLDWPAWLKQKEGGASLRIPRIILSSTQIDWSDDPQARLQDVNLLINWRSLDDTLEAAGSGIWNGEAVQVTRASLDPTLLVMEKPSPFVLDMTVPSGTMSLSGEAQIGDDPRITGQSTIQANSLSDFSRWSGIALPLGPLLTSATVAGDFSLTRRRLSWPSVNVTLGESKLDGSLSVRLDEPRPTIAGTLAADTLDLSAFFAPFARARTASGAWSDDEIGIERTTDGDLDLRLSAATAQLGLVRFGDMAASILIKPGEIEASLGRASFHDGNLKGKLSLTQVDKATEIKAQASFDQVDTASFLALIGEPHWITGRAQGQIQLEGTGHSAAEWIRQSHGHTTIKVQQGEVIGIGLNEMLKRIDKRPLAASLDWKGGRTAFETAQASLNITSGIGEVTEGHLDAPSLHAALQGDVSLIERSLNLKAAVDQGGSNTVSPLIVFDINGNWDTVSVTPEVKSLIQRSGAAKPLFGPGHLATQGAAGSLAAQ